MQRNEGEDRLVVSHLSADRHLLVFESNCMRSFDRTPAGGGAVPIDGTATVGGIRRARLWHPVKNTA